MGIPSTVNCYYVDEAGDLVLFGRRGKVLVGTPGCSSVFMIGVAHLPDPQHAAEAMEKLRQSLLSDPYFKDVPSMSVNAGKTALAFHAKDDLPEVRREVFKLLPSIGAKVQVALKRKDRLVTAAKVLYSTGKRFHANDIYDDLVKRLFRNLLHKADENRVIFSRRGKSERTEAMQEAIAKAKRNFEGKYRIASNKPTRIESGYPSSAAGLQVIDYYLWALQRLYERGEDRFFELLSPSFRLIMDLDDTRNKPYGEWYSDGNPLHKERIEKPL